MTDWRDMEAGPELDALIDRRVEPAAFTRNRKGYTSPYSTSTDVALLLCKELPAYHHLALKWFPFSICYASIVKLIGVGKDIRWRGEAEVPALAICRAWLAYMDAKDDE